jgi:hypothetical protein
MELIRKDLTISSTDCLDGEITGSGRSIELPPILECGDAVLHYSNPHTIKIKLVRKTQKFALNIILGVHFECDTQRGTFTNTP